MSPMKLTSQTRRLPARPPAWGRRCQGLSLVELMIALTIGLLLLAGVTTLLVNSSNSRRELDKATRQLENARYAQLMIGDDLSHAGYYGQFFTAPAPGEVGFPAALPDPCSTSVATIEGALSLHLQGYNNPTTAALPSCIDADNYQTGTDILVVRRVETRVTASGSLVDEDLYLQSNSLNYVFAAAPSAAFTLKKKNGTTDADIRKFVTHIYYVSPCNIPASGATCNGVSDDGGRSIPTLKRLELTVSGGAAVFEAVPIAEGIENLQLDYGLDNVGTADGSPDAYSVPASTTDWYNAVTVRVNVLARDTEPTPGYTNTKTYVLGATNVAAANDSYKRHAYNRLVRVINASSRREE